MCTMYVVGKDKNASGVPIKDSSRRRRTSHKINADSFEWRYGDDYRKFTKEGRKQSEIFSFQILFIFSVHVRSVLAFEPGDI